MKKTLFTVKILSVLTWSAVIIPAVMLLKECIYSFINGTTRGFNSDQMLYGFSAFTDTFMFYFCFFFPLFFLWGCMVILSVSFTIASIVIKKHL